MTAIADPKALINEVDTKVIAVVTRACPIALGGVVPAKMICGVACNLAIPLKAAIEANVKVPSAAILPVPLPIETVVINNGVFVRIEPKPLIVAESEKIIVTAERARTILLSTDTSENVIVSKAAIEPVPLSAVVLVKVIVELTETDAKPLRTDTGVNVIVSDARACAVPFIVLTGVKSIEVAESIAGNVWITS